MADICPGEVQRPAHLSCRGHAPGLQIFNDALTRGFHKLVWIYLIRYGRNFTKNLHCFYQVNGQEKIGEMGMPRVKCSCHPHFSVSS